MDENTKKDNMDHGRQGTEKNRKTRRNIGKVLKKKRLLKLRKSNKLVYIFKING